MATSSFSTQQVSFDPDQFVEPGDVVMVTTLPEADEVIETEDYTLYIYHPAFEWWMQTIDETVMDLTGYSAYNFHEVPTPDTRHLWPELPWEAALEVLRRDAWGYEFLQSLDEPQD
jgi:hypothetical protein